jgi:hypothetical protein
MHIVPAKEKSKLLFQLRQYRKKFLVKKYENLDESATRLMINEFLTEILGYTPIEEIRTEYAIKGTYADYVIQLKRKKHFVIEVKAMQIDLAEQHLRQSLAYAANEGIDWIILTNGRQFKLFRVIFGKPISTKKILDLDIADKETVKNSIEFFHLLSKKSVLKKELESYWARFQALEPVNLAKLLYSEEIIKILKKKLKNKTGIIFSNDDLVDSIYSIIVLKIPSTKPKSGRVKKVKKLPGAEVAKDKELSSFITE